MRWVTDLKAAAETGVRTRAAILSWKMDESTAVAYVRDNACLFTRGEYSVSIQLELIDDKEISKQRPKMAKSCAVGGKETMTRRVES